MTFNIGPRFGGPELPHKRVSSWGSDELIPTSPSSTNLHALFQAHQSDPKPIKDPNPLIRAISPLGSPTTHEVSTSSALYGSPSTLKIHGEQQRQIKLQQNVQDLWEKSPGTGRHIGIQHTDDTDLNTAQRTQNARRWGELNSAGARELQSEALHKSLTRVANNKDLWK